MSDTRTLLALSVITIGLEQIESGRTSAGLDTARRGLDVLRRARGAGSQCTALGGTPTDGALADVARYQQQKREAGDRP